MLEIAKYLLTVYSGIKPFLRFKIAICIIIIICKRNKVILGIKKGLRSGTLSTNVLILRALLLTIKRRLQFEEECLVVRKEASFLHIKINCHESKAPRAQFRRNAI